MIPMCKITPAAKDCSMLDLRRHEGESVIIKVPPSAKETIITVHAWKIFRKSEPRKVTLGFEAPKWVNIIRSELEEKEPA